MSLRDQTVFVTGATGFLGGALALRLAEEGARVKALARSLHKSHFLRDHPHSDRIEVVHGDITNLERMQTIMTDCAVVFHAAAVLGNGDFALSRAVNVDGTRNIMRAAAESGVERVVHISSVAVYGMRCPDPITEDRGCQPSSDAYAITKAQAESVVREFGEAHHLPYTIIRPGGIFGPRSWWTRTFARLAQRPLIPLIGAGEGAVPAIDVDDVTAMCIHAATHPGAVNEAFTAVYDPAPTMRAVLELFARTAGRTRLPWLSLAPGPIRLAALLYAPFAPAFSRASDLPDLLARTYSYVRYSMDKARARMDWSPQIDLADSLQRTLPWLRAEGLLPPAGP